MEARGDLRCGTRGGALRYLSARSASTFAQRVVRRVSFNSESRRARTAWPRAPLLIPDDCTRRTVRGAWRRRPGRRPGWCGSCRRCGRCGSSVCGGRGRTPCGSVRRGRLTGPGEVLAWWGLVGRGGAHRTCSPSAFIARLNSRFVIVPSPSAPRGAGPRHVRRSRAGAQACASTAPALPDGVRHSSGVRARQADLRPIP